MDISKISPITNKFKRISLKEAEKAQLMQRVDSKYILPFEVSKEVLENVVGSYFIVDNNGYVVPEYISDYFDTPEFNMYLDHQNKRPRRYKIRVRNYCASGDSFLEIKLRTPSGKTVKKRISARTNDLNNENIIDFVASKSPYIIDELSKTLVTRFERLTLVSHDFNERITFDFNLYISLPNTGQSINYENISIVEVKRSKFKSNSEVAKLLKILGFRPKGFSKYSIGCALLYPNFKSNNFKKTLLYIKKIQDEYTQPNYANR